MTQETGDTGERRGKQTCARDYYPEELGWHSAPWKSWRHCRVHFEPRDRCFSSFHLRGGSLLQLRRVEEKWWNERAGETSPVKFSNVKVTRLAGREMVIRNKNATTDGIYAN